MIKRILLILVFSLSFYIGKSQTWKIDSTGVMTYKSQEINLRVTEDMIFISGIEKANIKLYDSIGHYIESWKDLEIKEISEEKRYKIIYRFLRNENGWIRFEDIDVPTVKKEKEFRK